MVYQTSTYKLVIFSNLIQINAFSLPEDKKIIYSIHDYYDKNFSNAIVSGEVLNGTTTIDTVGEDGLYTILIEYEQLEGDCHEIETYLLRDTYDFKIYTTFERGFIEEAKNLICYCTTCEDNKLSDCDDCIEFDDWKNSFNGFIFMMFYILMYYDILNTDAFHKYLKACLNHYEIKISNRFYKMLFMGKVRGTFELNHETMYILISALYTYIYFSELHNSDNSTIVKNKYDIKKIKNCLFDNGLNFEIFEQYYFEHHIFGEITQYILDPCDIEPCSILNVLETNSFSKNKEDFQIGINVLVTENNTKLAIILPKIWGKVYEILDNGNIDIKNNFQIIDYKNYYVYLTKDTDTYAIGVYKFKINYND